jgi:mxaD protein
MRPAGAGSAGAPECNRNASPGASGIRRHEEVSMNTTILRWMALGMASLVWTTAAIAANVIQVREKVELPVAADKAWEVIKDFNSWQTWHPALATDEITSGKGNTRGTIRVLTTKDGARITEQLLHYQPKALSYTYKIIDGPLPVTDYVSTLQVHSSKNGSVVLWNSHFKAKEGTSDDDAAKAIRDIYRAGLGNLKNKLK